MFIQKKLRHVLPTDYQLHEYCIQSVLGNGGFGITYLAQDTLLNVPVAIKEYLPNELAVRESDYTVHPKSQHDMEDFSWGLERFWDEAQILARFKHTHIIRVLRFFRANHTAYIVMDYEHGQSLAEAFPKKQSITETKLMEILLPLLDALETVHNAGYLHRDIKPDNIYLRTKDNSPVLLDFGAARYRVGSRSHSFTIIMSAGYTPFEQYAYDSNHGNWSDIYSLGAVLYRLISGQTPIDAIQRIDALRRDKPDPLIPALKIGRRQYSQRLLQAIDLSLQINEEARPPTISLWRELLLLPTTHSTSWLSQKTAANRSQKKVFPPKKMAKIKSKRMFASKLAEKSAHNLFSLSSNHNLLNANKKSYLKWYGLIILLGILLGYGWLNFKIDSKSSLSYEKLLEIIPWLAAIQPHKTSETLESIKPETQPIIQLTSQEMVEIGQQIWLNESAGQLSGLTSWNENENFASLGIGHFIWYPASSKEPFKETWPNLLAFIQKQKVMIPAWLTNTPACPWQTREEFIQNERSYQMNSLRRFMKNTIPQQIQFMKKRLEEALPQILETLSTQKQRQHVREQFERLAQTSNGIYVLIDYVNFKGEGISPTERYKGQGWGLLQVLRQMSGHSKQDATLEFAKAAELILERRIKNAPPERNEAHWLEDWKKRINTYRELKIGN
jgi:serine/threonine protein kinase